jgi:hypothetical protein
VGVSPADPWLDAVVPSIEVKGIGAERNCAHDFDSGKAHEANITAGSKVVVARKELIELGTTLVELDYAPNCVEGGNETDEDGWADYKDIGRPDVVGEGITADILEDVETMALDDVLKCHLQDGETEADRQVDNDVAALLGLGDSH